MISHLNDHAPATFQPMHHPAGASGAISSMVGKSFISSHGDDFIEEIRLSHLDTASELEKVQGLRDHINLPSGCRNEQFFEQEKKETNWVWCLRSRSIGP